MKGGLSHLEQRSQDERGKASQENEVTLAVLSARARACREDIAGYTVSRYKSAPVNNPFAMLDQLGHKWKGRIDMCISRHTQKYYSRHIVFPFLGPVPFCP